MEHVISRMATSQVPSGYPGLAAALLGKCWCGMSCGNDRDHFSLVLDPTWYRSLHLLELLCGIYWLCPAASWHQCFGECGSLVCCCVFDFTSEGADGFLWSLNKDDCSSERALLSNKYRISWMMAKPKQVFYSLVGTHFAHFLEMPCS